MNPFIVVEIVHDLANYNILNSTGFTEYVYQLPSTDIESEHHARNIYEDPSGMIYALAATEEQAKELAIRCAYKKPGSRWMWYQLKGIATCPAAPVEITQVTDQGALPA